MMRWRWVVALLFLFVSQVAYAQQGQPAGGFGVSSVSIVTANGVSGTCANPTTTPACTISLGNNTPAITGVLVAVNPGSIGIGTPGTGYTVGDLLTLSLAGATFTTPPQAVVAAVSGGVPTEFTLINSGVATTVPAASGTFSTSGGTGSGATITGSFGPIAATISMQALNQGGNLFINQPVGAFFAPQAENVFIGPFAGGNFTSSFNTAVGENSCGIGLNVAVTGGNNTCLGNDNMRNIGATAQANTSVGNNALRNQTGNSSAAFGQSTAQNYKGNNSLFLGTGIVQNSDTGNNVIIIGLGSVADTPTTSTGQYFGLFGGTSTTPLISIAGINAPTTATTTLHGSTFLIPDALTSQGGTCNSAAGQLSTTTTGCPGFTLAIASGGTGDTGTAWSTYSPTVTCSTSGTITTDTVAGRSKTIGKTVFIQVNVNIATLGTCLGNLQISVPVAANGTGASYPISGFNSTVGTTGLPASVTSASGIVIPFVTAPAANNYYVAGVYESSFLLGRDIEPASNDNLPLYLNAAA